VRFLFVCTGNTDRSPAAERVLARISGGTHDSRSAGILAGSPRVLDGADLDWADVVAVMEDRHRQFIAARWPDRIAKVHVLGIADRYRRDERALGNLLESHLEGLLARVEVV
jgi:predicted protein tyrosine phosphatase